MRAIDVHAHVTSLFGYRRVYGETITQAMEKYYRIKDRIESPDDMANMYRELDVKAILVAWDTESVSGIPRIENDFVAGLVKKYPDVFIGGWAMIDPWKGELAIKELERCIKELGLLGLKFQPIAQRFYPNDKRFYPLYEKCCELGIPVSFHTGTSGLGAGLPGGAGYKLDYTRPIYIDEVAADFPELTIIMIHPAWPWQEEQIMVLLHKANVYADLSGWAPRYFPEVIKREINSRLQDKFMFGSDYPEISPKRWLDEFTSQGYKEEVIEKVLYKNAQRILNLKV